MRQIILIAHNLRSTHNVGSLMRTAEGLGVDKFYLTGITPYPKVKKDSRLPHLALKLTKQINKTALGAESILEWQYHDHLESLMVELKRDHYQIIALEQTTDGKPIEQFEFDQKVALVIGNELEGIDESVLRQVDSAVFIRMFGKKESFNVVQAAAMALYDLRFY
jgi:23S rRNA (guanosine2251-2'-O)-methyltransferase